jgi:ubiquinone/menaquinone biosynthesis C-methylase UbiE
VTAIERNDNMVKWLSDNKVFVHKAEDLTPVKGQQFDMAIAMFVFQHIGRKKVDKILKQMRQVTTKICFTLPMEYKGGSYKSQTEGANQVHGESETSYVYTHAEIDEMIQPHFPNLRKLNVKNENVFIAFV